MGKGRSIRGKHRRAVLAEALEPRRLLSSTALPVSVSVAYYDTEHASPPAPTPWMGSPNTTFFGNVDSTGVWDGGAILITNPGPGNATIAPGLRVDGFANSASFQLWDGNIGTGLVLAPGKSVIFAQPTTGAFDTSDQPIINNPAQRTNNQPVVHLTINGQQYNLTDTNQIINTGGFDPGEAYGVSESLPWTQVGNPGTAVLTGHDDNARSGLNSSELQLTPGNVNQATFGKKFSYPVDGQVYAQPLYVPNLAIPGKGTHNVVIIATEHDSVYAFDADNSSTATGGGLLWQVSVGNAAASPPPGNVWGYRYGGPNIQPWIGITGTPVIDPSTNIMYLDAFTNDSAGVWTHHIHALSLTTGADVIPPVLVAATSPGNGVGGDGTTETFTATQELQRPALSLLNGQVFVAYGSYADTDPYHGWVLGYNASNLQLQSIFNSTPNLLTPQGANPGEGAFWQAGAGLASDGTNLYGITGNGDFNAAIGDYGDSFVKLTPTSSSDPVTGYFTPYNQQQLSDADEDLGSGGVMVLPDSVGSAAHPHLLVGCGKQGIIYLIDANNMGGYDPATDHVIQEVNLGSGTWSSPAYFNGRIYFHGVGDVIKAFSISNGVMSSTPVATSTISYAYPGATPSISSNGALDGIVWDVQSGATLHAYNASTLAEIYNSDQVSSRDQLGSVANFITPTIADGHVFVGTNNSVVVYGLFPPPANPPAAPTLLTGVAQNFQTVNLKWQDNSDNEDGFYIWRSPHNANTWVQIGTAIVNATTYADTTVQATTTYDYEVQAHNTYNGTSVSAFTNVVTVTTPAPPPVGTGDGLSGAYFVDQVTSQPHFNAPATLTRTDASIDFDWGNGSPAPSITVDHFSVIWTGQFKPTTTQVYTFSTTSDDGVRLFINGTQVINDFADHAPTVDTATMSLTAGTTYSFEMDYYEDAGGAAAKLHWNTSTIADTPVPFLNGGATGQYFNDPASGSGYTHLQGTPVVKRVDPQIDSTTWPNYTPDPAVGNTNFSVKWTGRVQPQYTETYTFSTLSDDGVMLLVNGQQLVNDWTDHGTTTDSGTISLVAGLEYNIEMDFYQASGPDFAQLQWSSPSTPQQLIPQSQLYSSTAAVTPLISLNIAPSPLPEGQSLPAFPVTFIGTGGGAFTATVNYGDGSPAIHPAISGNSFTIPPHGYAEEGADTITITITVADSTNGLTSNPKTIPLTITPAPVQVSIGGVPAMGLVLGGGASLTFTAANPNPLEMGPLVESWTIQNAAHVTLASGTGPSTTFTPPAAGAYTVSFSAGESASGADAETGTATATLTVVTAGGPLLSSITVDDGTRQRSMVRSLTLAFTSPVTLAPGALSLARMNAGGSGSNDNSAPSDASAALGTPATSDGGMTWVVPVNPSSAFSAFGSLSNGIYTLTLHGSLAQDVQGRTPPTDRSLTFHRLFGDANGDRRVNAVDYGQFNAAFGSNSSQGAYNPYFDFNHDNRVNAVDYGQFSADFGKSLSWVSYSYVTDKAAYTGAAGSGVAVKVYLLESRGTLPSPLTADGGLLSAGAGLAEVSGPASGAAAFAAVSASSDFAGPVLSGLSATAANLQEAVGPASPPVGVQLGNTGGGASPGTPANEVYVGTFTVTVGT
ncbi:MAG TPA: PA14 domain-containing protein, partial [Tepidisphaeraceae bacterium]|nr:PA14 domain-containing protein [Tepidisphaeraceae bacterium]